MKFTAKELFRSKGLTFEEGNRYDSANYGLIADEDVERWYSAGWCEVEGRDPAPARRPGAVTVRPTKALHATGD